MAINLDDIEQIRDERLAELRALEQEMYSSRVQSYWEQNGTDAEKEDFIQTRNDVVLSRVKLENTILEQIAGRLREYEQSLKLGIENLEQELQSLKNTVEILNTLGRVAGIMARILLLV